jgi:KDO2-lipid IV(A) lauroyltransferase
VNAVAARSPRCGIDSVEVARVERMLADTPAADLSALFSADELRDAGDGPGRAGSLAARLAAKEACLKLFPRETALNTIAAPDFSVVRDVWGAPEVVCSPTAEAVRNRHRIARITLSMTHDRTNASAVALAEPAVTEVTLSGRLFYHLLPLRRRVIMANLRRVYGDHLPDAEITRIAQAHYGHVLKLPFELLAALWTSPERRAARVRIENEALVLDALAQRKGIIVLTGHFGNWEVATVSGISLFPELRGHFHFVRRRIKWRWLDALVARHFRNAGFGILAKRDTLDAILDRLADGDVVVFPFDQHARGKDGIPVEFFGHPAGTFRSLAVIALATGAPVLPAASWREPDGSHVLRFEEPLPLVDCENTDEAIRRNTRAYNAALERAILRRPEQWWWSHRRWKTG